MNDTIAFFMMNELIGLKYAYKETIEQCYDAVCHQRGLTGDKDIVVDKVRRALIMVMK